METMIEIKKVRKEDTLPMPAVFGESGAKRFH